MADDHVADEEAAALREVYGEVMRCGLDAAELAQVSEEMHASGVQVPCPPVAPVLVVCCRKHPVRS